MAHLWISLKEDNTYQVQIFGIYSDFGMREFQNRGDLIASLQRTFEYSQDSLNNFNEKLDDLIGKPKGSVLPVQLSTEQSQRLIERDLK